MKRTKPVNNCTWVEWCRLSCLYGVEAGGVCVLLQFKTLETNSSTLMTPFPDRLWSKSKFNWKIRDILFLKSMNQFQQNNSSFALTFRPRCSERTSSLSWSANPSQEIISSLQASRSLASREVDGAALDPRGVLGSSGFHRHSWPTNTGH